MKIKTRQNRFYSFFNGKNKIRTIFFILWGCYLLSIILIGKFSLPFSFAFSYICNLLILALPIFIVVNIILLRISRFFYYPRFNPHYYFNLYFEHRKMEFTLHQAVCATKKYIDRHYSHQYNANILLSRIRHIDSETEALKSLPPSFVVGIVTGFISGIITSFSTTSIENFSSLCAKIAFILIITLILLLLSYFAQKSFYSEYNSLIVPYEKQKIKDQLKCIDDIYSNI